MQFFATLTLALAATTAVASGQGVGVELLNAINAARATNGRTPLCISGTLAAASQIQANNMAAGGWVGSAGPDGSMPTDRAQAMGFNTTAVFEVVGAGYADAQTAVNEWMKLADRDQYLLGDFKFLGAARTINEAQLYKSFWVVDFAQGSSDEKCASLTSL